MFAFLRANPAGRKPCLQRPIRRFFAQFLSVVLLGAAVLKFFSPAEGVRLFEKSVAVAELLLALVFVLFYEKIFIWVGAGFLFAGFAGYAFFWVTHGLPCGCLGRWVRVPSFVTFFFDLGCVLVGWLFGIKYYSLKRRWFCLFLLVFCGISGYLLGKYLYNHVLAAHWSGG